MNLKQKVMSGLLWTAGAKLIGQLITWCVTLVVIRLLSPVDYGLMSLTMVFVGFITMLSELGIGAAIVQKSSLTETELKALFGLLLIAGLVFCLLLLAAAPFIALFYSEPHLVGLIQFLSLKFLIMAFIILPQSLLLRDMAFRKIGTIDFVSAILGSFVTLFLAINGYGVWALAWGTLFMRLATAVGLNMAYPFIKIPVFKVSSLFDFLSFGGYVTLSKIFWYLYIRADLLIVGKMLGKEALGFYSIGMYLACLPMEKISGLINQVAFPAFTSVQSEPQLASRHFLKAVRVMSFIAFPVLWGISSVAPEIVNIFIGLKWNSATLPLQIIAISIPFRMVGNLVSPASLGLGHPEIPFYDSVTAFIFMPIAFAIGSFWGITGVSIAWLSVFPLIFVWNISRITSALGINVFDVFKAMQNPFISAFMMVVLIHILRLNQIFMISETLKLLVFIFIGAVAYFSLSFVSNQKGLTEVRDLIKI